MQIHDQDVFFGRASLASHFGNLRITKDKNLSKKIYGVCVVITDSPSEKERTEVMIEQMICSLCEENIWIIYHIIEKKLTSYRTYGSWRRNLSFAFWAHCYGLSFHHYRLQCWEKHTSLHILIELQVLLREIINILAQKRSVWCCELPTSPQLEHDSSSMWVSSALKDHQDIHQQVKVWFSMTPSNCGKLFRWSEMLPPH